VDELPLEHVEPCTGMTPLPALHVTNPTSGTPNVSTDSAAGQILSEKNRSNLIRVGQIRAVVFDSLAF